MTSSVFIYSFVLVPELDLRICNGKSIFKQLLQTEAVSHFHFHLARLNWIACFLSRFAMSQNFGSSTHLQWPLKDKYAYISHSVSSHNSNQNVNKRSMNVTRKSFSGYLRIDLRNIICKTYKVNKWTQGLTQSDPHQAPNTKGKGNKYRKAQNKQKMGKKKVKGVPQSQTAVIPWHREEEKTDKIK